MNDFIFSPENILPKLNKLELDYPDLNNFFNADDVNERLLILNNIYHCEITGIKFESLNDIFFIPTKPFENVKVGAYQTALVCEEAYIFYRNLYNYIIEHPELQNIEKYKTTLLRFQLTKDNVLTNSEKEKIEVLEHSYLFSIFDMKTKREKLKDAIKNSNSPVINNLSPVENKKIISEQKIKNFKNPKEMPGRLAKISVEEKERDKISLFLVKQVYYKLSTFRKISEEKGFTCNMNYNNSKHFFEVKHCQLTGMTLTKNDFSGPANRNSFSIDRINRFEGYNTNNVIVMCHFANQMKGHFEQFNYSKDVNELKEILERTKDYVLNYYKNKKKSPFVESKVIPIDTIIQNYIKNH